MPESALRPGDRIEVVVEKGVYRGQGLARHEGQVVFIPRALPGDRVRVRVDAVTHGYARATAEVVLEGGPGRREPPCPFAVKCGGCAYQHYGYAEQLRLKEAVLRESLGRAGAPWEGEIPVHGSPEEGWRTRASLHLQWTPQGPRLGFYEEGTHRVVPVERCLQLSEGMNRVAQAIVAGLADRRRCAGRIHGLELAESGDGLQLVAALETSLEPREATELAPLGAGIPALGGFGATTGSGHRQRYLSLRGDPHVETAVHGFRLRSHIRSFFQANRFLVDDLVQAVLDGTPAGGSVLDLYAGVGLFALPLAARAEAVRGLELNPNAVEDAQANLQRAGLGHVRIHQGDVREGLASLRPRPDERVILDPPRTGATAEVVRLIAARKPRSIVYVSCDPATLGRDLKLFASEGYVAGGIEAFDLFPDTFHMETVVRLSPRRTL